jgi:hypothetical protein
MIQFKGCFAHLQLVLNNCMTFLVLSSLYYFRSTESVNCVQVANY